MTNNINNNGPRKSVTIKYVCDGCPALTTKPWEEFLDNDEKDSGITATCNAMQEKVVITTYHNKGNPAPAWCPHDPVPLTTAQQSFRSWNILEEMFAMKPVPHRQVIIDRIMAETGIDSDMVNKLVSTYRESKGI